MVRDEILLRVKTAYAENDYALVDKILSEGGQDWTAEEGVLWLRSLYLMGSFSECIKKCNEVLIRDNGNWSASLFIPRSLNSMGKRKEAIEGYENLSEVRPEESEPLIFMARHYFSLGDLVKSKELVNRLLQIDPKNEQGLLFRSRILHSEGDLEESLKSYLDLNSSFPMNLEGNGRIGQISYELEDYTRAKEFLLKALEIDEDYRPARRLIGLCIERLGETSEALGYLLAEADREPDIISNWEKIVDLYLKLNREDKAREAIQLAYETISDRVQAIVTKFSLARGIFWEKGVDEALHDLDTNFADDFIAHERMFRVLFDEGEISKSINAITRMEACEKNFSERKLSKHRDDVKNILRTVGRDLDEISSLEEDVILTELAIARITEIARGMKSRMPSKRRHTVIQISSSLGRGGAERQLAIGVAELNKSSVIRDVMVMTYEKAHESGSYAQEIRDSGVEVVHYGSSLGWRDEFSDDSLDDFAEIIDLLPPRFQRDLVPLCRAFKKLKPTIVHTWQDQTNITAGLAAMIARVPVVIMFGRSMRPDGKTMLHIRNRPYLKSGYLSLLQDRRFRLCLNSNKGRESYSEWLGIDQNLLDVIPNGIDFERLKREGNSLEVKDFFEQNGIGDKTLIVGGVFRFVKEKRLELWVESAKKVLQKRDDVVFIAVGDGRERGTILDLVRDNELYKSRILFPGSTKSVISWLEAFDLFLLTSSIEGLPNVLIEAQAAGVPVLATPAGGSEDTFSDYISGVLLEDESSTEIAEKICRIMEDVRWREEAALNASKMALEKFSLQTMVENIEEIYNCTSKENYDLWVKQEGVFGMLKAALGRD